MVKLSTTHACAGRTPIKCHHCSESQHRYWCSGTCLCCLRLASQTIKSSSLHCISRCWSCRSATHVYPHATPNNQVNIAALHVDGLRLERQSSAITAFESHNHPVHTVFEGVVAMKEGAEEEEAEEEGGRGKRVEGGGGAGGGGGKWTTYFFIDHISQNIYLSKTGASC